MVKAHGCGWFTRSRLGSLTEVQLTLASAFVRYGNRESLVFTP